MSITRRLAAWSSLIAALVLFALAWLWLSGQRNDWRLWAAVVGAVLLATALINAGLGALLARWLPAWQLRQQERARRKAMERLDWKVIEGGAGRKRDCEKPGTLGVCTGLECYFYEGCNFNIKKFIQK